PQLVAFRGLQGLGSGTMQTASLALLSDLFVPRERGKWQAVNSMGFALATGIGPPIGGLISDNTSWRWIFFLNVPVAIAAIFALVQGSPKLERTRRPSIDWVG